MYFEIIKSCGTEARVFHLAVHVHGKFFAMYPSLTIRLLYMQRNYDYKQAHEIQAVLTTIENL